MSLDDWPVEVDPVFGCWLWIGRRDKRDGRPLVWEGKRPMGAHRVVYEAEVGPVPVGLVLDHWCRRPTCVAPHHIEPVTPSVNEHRKSFAFRSRMRKCKRGHDLWVNRVIVPPQDGQVCRQCNRDASGGAR